jgi:hypothetical protein
MWYKNTAKLSDQSALSFKIHSIKEAQTKLGRKKNDDKQKCLIFCTENCETSALVLLLFFKVFLVAKSDV